MTGLICGVSEIRSFILSNFLVFGVSEFRSLKLRKTQETQQTQSREKPQKGRIIIRHVPACSGRSKNRSFFNKSTHNNNTSSLKMSNLDELRYLRPTRSYELTQRERQELKNVKFLYTIWARNNKGSPTPIQSLWKDKFGDKYLVAYLEHTDKYEKHRLTPEHYIEEDCMICTEISRGLKLSCCKQFMCDSCYFNPNILNCPYCRKEFSK